MSLAGQFGHSERFPIFDGNDYPFWKQKMKIKSEGYQRRYMANCAKMVHNSVPESPTLADEEKHSTGCSSEGYHMHLSLKEVNSFGSEDLIQPSKSGMASRMSMKNFKNEEMLTLICFEPCSPTIEVFEMKVLWNSPID